MVKFGCKSKMLCHEKYEKKSFKRLIVQMITLGLILYEYITQNFYLICR